jgi:hypothetical protein
MHQVSRKNCARSDQRALLALMDQRFIFFAAEKKELEERFSLFLNEFFAEKIKLYDFMNSFLELFRR